MGSTGFGSDYWNVRDTLYNDAVMRTNSVLKNPENKLVAILWHQGESDIGNRNYQQNLDSMILNILFLSRNRIPVLYLSTTMLPVKEKWEEDISWNLNYESIL